MTTVVNPAGWNKCGNSANEATARFSEYRSSGDGATIVTRPCKDTSTKAANYTVTNILKTTYTNPVIIDNWNPDNVISSTGATIQ